jgi:hypothetical protein
VSSVLSTGGTCRLKMAREKSPIPSIACSSRQPARRPRSRGACSTVSDCYTPG